MMAFAAVATFVDTLRDKLPGRRLIDSPPDPSHSPSILTSLPTDETRYPRSHSDVFHVAFLLRQVLIPDLIPLVLDHAQYWVRLVAETNEPATVSERDSPKLYLAAPLPDPRVLRRVTFTVTSRDQGWSNQNGGRHGTYAPGWTWLEVLIYEPDASNLVRLIGSGHRIIKNVHTGKEYKRYVVTWDHDDDTVKEVFQQMTLGRHIGLTAWARMAGWENCLADARIDFDVAVVHRG